MRQAARYITLWLLGMTLAGAAAASPPVLIERASGAIPHAMPAVLRAGLVHVHRDVLEQIDPAALPAVRLELLDGIDLVATIHAVEHPVTGGPPVYRGTLRGVPGGSVIIGAGDGVVLASVWAPGIGVFELGRTAGGTSVVTELDTVAFAPCDTGDGNGGGGPIPAGAASGDCNDDGSVIDMLVVYTPAARSGAGGVAAIQTVIAMAAAATNDAYASSSIAPVVQVVMTAEVAYVESGSSSTDLSRLTSPADGFMDQVHGWRDDAAADVVSLIVETLSSCGRANFSIASGNLALPALAFNVTKRSCAVGNLTFAHELGHNQGARHDRGSDNSDGGAFLYSHGYDPGSVFRTVMGVSNLGVPRVPHFSNPDVLYMGQPTGIDAGEPDSAHNAMSIGLTAFNVANFRCGDVPVPCPWDCNDDGVVGTIDLLLMLAEWGMPASPCDVDGGGVGTSDLLSLLANWGSCP